MKKKKTKRETEKKRREGEEEEEKKKKFFIFRFKGVTLCVNKARGPRSTLTYNYVLYFVLHRAGYNAGYCVSELLLRPSRGTSWRNNLIDTRVARCIFSRVPLPDSLRQNCR